MDTLGDQAEVFFVRLIMKADDFGRFTANPKLLRSLCFPLRSGVRENDISRWLAACHKAGLVRLYNAGGREYLEIAKFRQQTRTPSKHPSPDDGSLLTVCVANDKHLRTPVGVGGVVEDEGVVGAPPGANLVKKDRGTPDEIAAFCASLGLPASDSQWLAHKWHGNGWQNGGRSIKDWKATVRSWHAAGYMPSQKNGAKPGGLDKSRTIQLTQAEMPPIWRP